MNRNRVITLLLCTVLILVLFVGTYSFFNRNSAVHEVDVYVGIDAAYADVSELKARIDQVKDYTNMFVIGSTGITLDEAKLNEISKYITACGLSFATYTHTTKNTSLDFNQQKWTDTAKQQQGNKFLGLYCYDEPGGYQIDQDPVFMIAREANNYSEAANRYTQYLHEYISEFIALDTKIMTADYALYEYDYRAGYDLVMAEYAWNHSRSINTALCQRFSYNAQQRVGGNVNLYL
jgi:hypothetical protein